MTVIVAQTVLTARNLTRCFKHNEIIHGISLELKRGEVLGLLGPNGAGKSTTLQMLGGALLPHSGQIEVCGIDLARHPINAKTHIGFLPEIPPLHKEMRVDDYLDFVARLHRIRPGAIRGALGQSKQRCGLQDVGNRLIGTLSKGYQQRVGIAQAIIHSPDVIILDEPTSGLDPAQIRDIRTLIRELGDSHSVILSSHLISEVESICDRVHIMQNGRLVYTGTLNDMRQPGNGQVNLEATYIRITENASAKGSP